MNALQLVEKYLQDVPFDSGLLYTKKKKELEELLLTTWKQSAAKHNRASDTWYEQEENQYGVTLVPVEFSVTLPPTDTDTETLPSDAKKD